MFIRWILLFTLTIWWLPTSSSGVHAYSMRENVVKDSGRICPIDGIPVCGVKGKDLFIFPNQCSLDELNKDISQGLENYRKLPMHHCIHDCNLACPKVYQPICALNVHTQERNVFVSLCDLTKYACQTNMDFIQLNIRDCELVEILNISQKSLAKRSKQQQRRPVPCTRLFKPVCGTYKGVKSTFRNECLLNAENITFGKDWRLVKNGICDEDNLRTRQSAANKANKPHSIRKRSYNSNNYIQYPPRNTYMDYNLQMPFSYLNPYANMYTMPQFYPAPYQQTDTESRNFNSEDILKRIIALPPSPQDSESAPEEDDQEIEASDVKPMQYSMNGMGFQHYRPVYDSHEDSGHKTVQIDPYEENNIHSNDYYFPYHQTEPGYVNKEMAEMEEDPIISTTTSTETPNHTTSSTEEFVQNIPRTPPKAPTCKFGDKQICGALSNGTVKTFQSICEMMSENMYLKNTWVKLHEGRCDSCKYDCSREYTPVCVQRNGVNYTMVNDCYFNMGICMDKISKWKKIADGECKRYTRIPDKYEHLQPGFKYTSSYYVSNTNKESLPLSTTELTTSATTPATVDTTATTSSKKKVTGKIKLSEESESTKRSPKINNIVSKRFVRRLSNQPASVNAPWSNLSPAMDTYIMNLVRSKDRAL